MEQMDDMLHSLVVNQNLRPNHDLQMTNLHDRYNISGAFQGIKLDFPHFEWENLARWIFKTSQYFAYHQTSPA